MYSQSQEDNKSKQKTTEKQVNLFSPTPEIVLDFFIFSNTTLTVPSRDNCEAF